MNVFTPLSEDRTERLSIPVAEVKVISGDLNVRKRGKKARISVGGETFDVHGISCGIPGCVCDALLKKVA